MKKKYTKAEWRILFANNGYTFECPKVYIVYFADGKEVSEYRWKRTVHRTLWKCTRKLFFLIPVPCFCYYFDGTYYVRGGFHLTGRCPK